MALSALENGDIFYQANEQPGALSAAVFARSRVSCSRRIVTLLPLAQPVQARKQDPLGDIGLVELIADLPFQVGRDDQLAPQAGMGSQPVIQACARAGHDREKGKLVHNPVIDRRRLKEKNKG